MWSVSPDSRSSTIGHDALGDVTVEVEYQGESYKGRGVSTDTVEATLLAILSAVNRIVLYPIGERQKAQG